MRHSRIFRFSLAAFLALVVLLAAGIMAVRSRAFHQYVLATIIEHAQQATGGRVEIGDYAIRLGGLRADLYRIVLHGTESDPLAPLFQADRLGVAVNVASIWSRKIDVQEIVIDQPVVRLSIDKRGQTNIPQTQPRPTGSKPVNIFDLGIGHLVLNRGEIYYNDRQIPLAAQVRDLQAQVSIDPSKTGYDGTLSYREGRVEFGDFNPLQHDFEARFNAAPSGFTLSSMELTSAPLRVMASARLRDYINPSVEGSYQAVASTDELGKLLKNKLLPKGHVTTKGTVRYRSDAGESLLNSLSIDGRIDSPELAIDLPEARASVRSLRGEYRLDRGAFEVSNVQAEALGGHMAANLAMRHLADKPEARVEGTVRGISLAAMSAALRAGPAELAAITGRLDGTVKASWRGSMQALQVSSDAAFTAQAVEQRTAGGRSAIPLNGAVHLAYDGDNDVISLRRTYLRTPHTSVALEGSLGSRSSLGIQARSDDLREVDLLALVVRGSAQGQAQPAATPPEPLGLGGSVSFNGQLQGPIKEPRLTGQLGGENLRYQRTTLRGLRTQLDLRAGGIALRQGQLQTSSQGRVEFDITVGLRNWSYAPENPVRLQVATNRLPVADIQQVANLQYPITGILSANLSLEGSQTNPVGRGSVRLSEARAWDQPIQDLSLQLEGTGNAIRSTVNLDTPAGSGTARASFYPKEKRYEAQVDFPGIHLEKLDAVRTRNLQVGGVVRVSARGQGTLTAPQLEAIVEAPKLQLHQKVLDGLKLRAGLAQQQATFNLDSSVSGAYVQARGTVNLNSDYDATANIDTRAVQLGPLLVSYLNERGRDIRGETELHGWLKGPLKHPERLEAHLEIPTFSLGYQSAQIANASPIRIDYRDGTVTLERAELKGTGTDLQLKAVIPVAGDGTMRATATGNVDLQILRMLNPAFEISGQVNLNVDAQGTQAHPDIHGVVQVVNAAFQAPDAPLGAEKVNAKFEVQKDRVDIRTFTAETGGGTVTAQGSVVYQSAPRFNVGLSAKEVRLRYPDGVRAMLNSDLALNGTPESAVLTGQVLIDRLSFTESFDLATFADQFSGPSSAPSEGIAQNIKLDLAVKSTQEMGLSSSKLSVQGSADLQVRGTAAEPVILGRTNITGGELFFNNRRYQVQNGVIQFVNPTRTEPIVNLSATTTVDQFDISLNFMGPIDRLRTNYTSDPALPPVDVINLLLTGKTTEAAAASPSTPQSVVAGQLAGQASSRLGKLAGITSLTIDPQIGGSQNNPGARLAIQQRVTKNLFFTFATDVTTAQGQAVQVEYQVTRKYSLSAVRNQNGGHSVQAKIRKRF